MIAGLELSRCGLSRGRALRWRLLCQAGAARSQAPSLLFQQTGRKRSSSEPSRTAAHRRSFSSDTNRFRYVFNSAWFREYRVSYRWQEKDVELGFLLGELHLGKVRFKGMVLNNGFNPFGIPPVLELPPAIEVAVVWSHPDYANLPLYTAFGPVFRYVPHRYERCYVDLQQSSSDYLKKFCSKSRYTLLKKVRKFTALSGGNVDLREFRRPEEMKEFLALARQISAKTYQERLLLHAGIPGDTGFTDEMHRLAESGSVRAYTLCLQAHPLAYLYCTALNGNLVYRFVGHDPEYSHVSPGVVLQYLALCRLFEEQRFTMLDFTEGSNQHKQFFSTGSMACADIYYFRNTAANRAIVMLHALLRQTTRTIAALLEALGIRPQLKKFLRQAACSRNPS
jgi:Acetyltransferase (GNAT) domain